LTFAVKICGWTGSECQIHSTSAELISAEGDSSVPSQAQSYPGPEDRRMVDRPPITRSWFHQSPRLNSDQCTLLHHRLLSLWTNDSWHDFTLRRSLW
jgi:hypothetical protein